ncbi:MAG: hypothetical protein GWN99_12200 [Gemmatimonadetes bacterium]|uniref:Outer membrane protein beta-barrel domain-containing protein n=1 Tax=Candidatus Kutchimonas denitrificans TaxID=3056748 RepID=A0AAE5CDC0_9BACT|nr:hypothetical protein [Gemmatimonadota bacterium]NIR75494.1 hypothetical protein [Candidatus Kutchimonas denitrificans]NIS01808.1 hypothetical protein [Gemmatimonadota bacterium]NIT67589.1 hypothetical protein [Gemmatimonadota bacterium]NIU53463.1 hypothetical protein [Gemmatimonadota bacterium]
MKWKAVVVLAGLLALPQVGSAQFISLRFVGLDMLGGAVVPGAGTDVGVTFGARFGFGDLFGGFARLGVEVDWWTARHDDPAYEIRNILGGIAIWKEIVGSGPVVPYLGMGGAIHSLDTAPVGRLTDPLPAEARRIAGARLGGSGFGGVAFALSRTRAMWILLEYRYTAVTDIPFQEIRLGFRLAGRRPVRSVASFP